MSIMNTIMANRSELPRRLLLLLTARTYRAPAFIDAAERLGIEVIKAISMHHHLAEYWGYPLGLEYDDPESCLKAITEFAAKKPLGAIIAVDDSGSLIAALASQALGLAHNSPESALAARDKHVMRQMLKRGGLPSPRFRLCQLEGENVTGALSEMASATGFPCVLKPLDLNGSRGVIRANDVEEFIAAGQRIYQMLSAQQAGRPVGFLVEQFIPGIEVAVEGMLIDGRLKILALFDKPDPLNGPFFEETIYVTPSRLPKATQQSISQVTAEAAEALGLREGPVHAELRLNDSGPWIIELAGRSIGGLCARTLRFGTDVSLEELIIRQAFGMEVASLERMPGARGVMMIPIPQPGLLKGIEGCEAARSVPFIEGVEITTQINHRLVPLPEGDSYLGFIFAKGPMPDVVEAALRDAHSLLSFDIAPELPMLQKDFDFPAQ